MTAPPNTGDFIIEEKPMYRRTLAVTGTLPLVVFCLFLIISGSKSAQAQGYWTPAYVGYSSGCSTVSGVSACTSAMASCQSYANQDNGTITSFVPGIRLNAYYTCNIQGSPSPSGTTPIYLTCPTGWNIDPNSVVGCEQYTPQELAGKLVGTG